MTPEQWLEKHYPIPASALAEASDEACLMHCENKWEGAKQENLPEGMTYEDHCVGNGGHGLIFDYETCALCVKYLDDECVSRCGSKEILCPIVRMQGMPCFHLNFDDRNIYRESENDPAPMIDMLKRTLEFVRNGG